MTVEPEPHRVWIRAGGAEDGRALQIIHVSFLGKSGYGKSSLINAIIGKPVMETCAVQACTTRPQNACFRIGGDTFLSFADVPGIGESISRDAHYLSTYAKLVARSDVVVYVLRADCRDHAIDLSAFERLFPRLADRSKVVLALNGCDKIEPLSRRLGCGPSDAQLEQIRSKIARLAGVFPGVRSIIPCCAHPAWNLTALTLEIASMLETAPGVCLSAAGGTSLSVASRIAAVR